MAIFGYNLDTLKPRSLKIVDTIVWDIPEGVECLEALLVAGGHHSGGAGEIVYGKVFIPSSWTTLLITIGNGGGSDSWIGSVTQKLMYAKGASGSSGGGKFAGYPGRISYGSFSGIYNYYIPQYSFIGFETHCQGAPGSPGSFSGYTCDGAYSNITLGACGYKANGGSGEGGSGGGTNGGRGLCILYWLGY